MASIEYSLFRAKFIKSLQASLFEQNLTPKDLFLKALAEKPSGELRKGNIWHIGNIEDFSVATGYFAIGRTTNSTIEKFDDSTGNFVEEELEESPYTHCVFDAQIGLIGVAKKPSLAPTAVNIADRIEDLLSQTKVIRENNVLVEIRPIPDPDEFLKALASAYQVSSFTAWFRGPNPFDADEHFQKPLSVYLSAANGEIGKTQIQGDDLNRKVLQDVTRSTAATGNEAFKETRSSIYEKPDEIFEKVVDRFSYDIVWITESKQLNARLDRQAGSFLLSGNRGLRIQEILDSKPYANVPMYKYRIHKDLYTGIFALLRKMNITSKSLYGDLDGLARSIRMQMQIYSV